MYLIDIGNDQRKLPNQASAPLFVILLCTFFVMAEGRLSFHGMTHCQEIPVAELDSIKQVVNILSSFSNTAFQGCLLPHVTTGALEGEGRVRRLT
jgi:hypothetical protein